MPDTSCSGEYPDMIKFFRILTNCGTSYKNKQTNKKTGNKPKEAHLSTLVDYQMFFSSFLPLFFFFLIKRHYYQCPSTDTVITPVIYD